ncbi:MAG: hypothetical protein ACTSPQ_11095 [Candidatus Helarchaeota archaeon]
MPNITFSVDVELYKRMKKHPEIKWSEILRRSIIEYLKKLEGKEIITVEELRAELNNELLQLINELDIKKEIEYYRTIKQLEMERLKRLTELRNNL